ncbi:Alpha/Beta hydrolase protein [Annulohypoxylon nitens]|nr:Alpha/Beta hydrolase protein [Annulohypoxylon nitens]
MLFITIWFGSFVYLATGANNITIPKLTGSFNVGTTVLEVIDYTRQDPWVKTPQPRDLIISLFYPTNEPPYSKPLSMQEYECRPAVQLPPPVATYLEKHYAVPNGSLHDIVTRACLDAPIAHPFRPLLLFTPGFQSSRLMYSDILTEIASYGWIVGSLDHPYETGIVEYPDGRVVYGLPLNDSNSTIVKNIDIRTADVVSVLNALSNSSVTDKIPGFYGRGPLASRLDTNRVGVFGHSLGGATALSVVANDTRFVVGANSDGSYWEPEIRRGTAAPFMALTAKGHDRTNDQSWTDAWPHLRGFKREYSVRGAKHNDFTDIPLILQLWAYGIPPNSGELGTINGTRIMAIQRAYLTSLFRRVLKGENDGLLDGIGMEEWPEVEVGV